MSKKSASTFPEQGLQSISKLLTGLIKSIDKKQAPLPVPDPTSLATAMESINA